MQALLSDTAAADSLDLSLQLQCPRCQALMRQACCNQCGFVLGKENGIWKAMPQERLAYYAQFIGDYERIRAAEGRGSHAAEFYLSLPYKDTSGRNQKQWAIRARTFSYLTRKLLSPSSPNAPVRVLDIGAGNGWLSFRLALAQYEPVAVDLLTNDLDGLGCATHFRYLMRRTFPRFQAESAHLPFGNDQFDVAIFNASFHYSEDYRASLSEALRCVRAGGLIAICDSPWYASDASGKRMVEERRRHFLSTFGTASDSIHSLEYLTDERLEDLERHFSIRWQVHTPWYGLQWAARPLIAKFRGRREPSRFRIYTARKAA
jgi:SAM-dependent methyltransferase